MLIVQVEFSLYNSIISTHNSKHQQENYVTGCFININMQFLHYKKMPKNKAQ